MLLQHSYSPSVALPLSLWVCYYNIPARSLLPFQCPFGYATTTFLLVVCCPSSVPLSMLLQHSCSQSVALPVSLWVCYYNIPARRLLPFQCPFEYATTTFLLAVCCSSSVPLGMLLQHSYSPSVALPVSLWVCYYNIPARSLLPFQCPFGYATTTFLLVVCCPSSVPLSMLLQHSYS